MQFFKNHNRGFTLLEMIVSIAIFTIVALVAVGALLRVVDTNKKAETLKTTINNLNFAFDSISREMRVGTNFYCIKDGDNYISHQNDTLPDAITGTCTSFSDNWSIFFYSSKVVDDGSGGVCHLIFAYRYFNGAIEKAEKSECDDTINDNNSPKNRSFSPITSPDTIFTVSKVKVTAQAGKQSFAQFHFVGYAGTKEKTKSYFDVQTSVSQRLPD